MRNTDPAALQSAAGFEHFLGIFNKKFIYFLYILHCKSGTKVLS